MRSLSEMLLYVFMYSVENINCVKRLIPHSCNPGRAGSTSHTVYMYNRVLESFMRLSLILKDRCPRTEVGQAWNRRGLERIAALAPALAHTKRNTGQIRQINVWTEIVVSTSRSFL